MSRSLTALHTLLKEMKCPEALARRIELALVRWNEPGWDPDGFAGSLLIWRGEGFEAGYVQGLKDNQLTLWAIPFVPNEVRPSNQGGATHG